MLPSELVTYSLAFEHAWAVPLDFEAAFHADLPGATLEALRRIGSRREALVDCLRPEGGAKANPQRVLGAAAAYLQALVPLVDAMLPLSEAEHPLRHAPDFSWTSSLDNPPRSYSRASSSLEFEFRNALVQMGLAIANDAALHAHSAAGDAAAMPDISKKLRAAAGVFDYLAAMPRTLSANELAPELLPSVLHALSAVCLAQAQQMAIAKAMANAATPPLLLAKLCKGVSDKYSTALGQLRSELSGPSWERLDETFRDHLDIMERLFLALSTKIRASVAYAALDIGPACALAALATRQIVTRTSLGGVGMPPMTGRGGPGPAARTALQAEQRAAQVLQRTYDGENGTIYFEVVPDAHSLPGVESTFIMSATPYARPESDEVLDLTRVVSEVPSVPTDTASLGAAVAAAAGVAPPAAPVAAGAGAGSGAAPDAWPCAACTFANPLQNAYCQACGAPRPARTTVSVQRGDKMILTCASFDCTQQMEAPMGSAKVQCPRCTTVNISIACGGCSTPLSFPEGSQGVTCPRCHALNKMR